MAVNCKNRVEHIHYVDGMHSSNIKPARKAHSLSNFFVLALFIYFICSNFLIYFITMWNLNGSNQMIFIADRT